MANDSINQGIFVSDLLEKTSLDDTDILILEDTENTKKVLFRNLRASLIDDKESPANYRIYSSEKVQSLINEVLQAIIDNTGDMKGDIEDLKTNKVTYKDLNIAITELDNKKLDKTSLDPVIQELEGTRKISEPITGKDLAYGTEDEKIHLQHLGSDILDAMTGKTEVSIPSVPTGGWTGDDLANGSIGALKLKKDFMYRGSYPEGDLNRLVETGYYEVAATVRGVPHYGDDMVNMPH